MSSVIPREATDSGTIRDYIAIARPDHWFKNVFMLPGAALAYVVGAQVGLVELGMLGLAIVSACLLASANYTINEYLDAEDDKHHPTKHSRPSASGKISGQLVVLQWIILTAAGLGLAYQFSGWFFATSVFFIFMGLCYNVRPVRTKERVYLDVLSESVNNPIRFLLGWFPFIGDMFPPSSVLLAYWMGGAFLMAVKRYSEYRFIGDPERAGAYRASFKRYSEETLLLSSFFYALTSAVFLGVFLVKYRIEFVLSLPLFAILFVWYLRIGMRAKSVTQTPEKLYKERRFGLFVIVLVLVVTVLFFYDLPWLNVLIDSRVRIN
ncbi:MAG: UbiA prenyltransferase family protein [Pseudomonadota bacterium]